MVGEECLHCQGSDPFAGCRGSRYSVKLARDCALEKRFVQISGGMVVNGLGVICCGGTCERGGIYFCQNFED